LQPEIGFWVNARKILILTDFLKCTFAGEIAKNRAFCGGLKMKTPGVHHAKIHHDGAPRKAACAQRLDFSSGIEPAAPQKAEGEFGPKAEEAPM
jgi:hypothetical protein